MYSTWQQSRDLKFSSPQIHDPKQVVQKADGDEKKRNRGDIIPGIINTAPVPVICMSGSVNEGDGLRRSCGKTGDGFTEGAGERGGKRRGEEKGWEDGMEKASHGENAIIKYKGWNTYCGDYGSFPYI